MAAPCTALAAPRPLKVAFRPGKRGVSRSQGGGVWRKQTSWGRDGEDLKKIVATAIDSRRWKIVCLCA